MKVKLIAYTPEPEKLCGSAAAVAYSSEGLEENYNKPEENSRKILNFCVNSGHHSITEHAVFTFDVQGISRACSHQLVRHRLASYTQQSQRYVKFDELDYVMPPEVENSDQKEKFGEIMKNLANSYKELLDSGIPAEDARYLFPNAAKTNIVVTMNARELIHFFRLRCCNRAQWEIHELADSMLKEAKKAAPTLFKNSGPNCVKGPCTEGKFTCGKMAEVKEKYESF